MVYNTFVFRRLTEKFQQEIDRHLSLALLVVERSLRYTQISTMAAAMFTASRKAAHAAIKTTGTRSLSAAAGADVLAGSG